MYVGSREWGGEMRITSLSNILFDASRVVLLYESCTPYVAQELCNSNSCPPHGTDGSEKATC